MSAPEGPQQWYIDLWKSTSFINSVFVQLWMEWLQKQSFAAIIVDIYFVVVCRLSIVSGLIADVLLVAQAGSRSTDCDTKWCLLSPT